MTGRHDAKMWQSLTREQRAWVTKLLEADQLAVDAREWLACAFAFDLGREYVLRKRESTLLERGFKLFSTGS